MEDVHGPRDALILNVPQSTRSADRDEATVAPLPLSAKLLNKVLALMKGKTTLSSSSLPPPPLLSLSIARLIYQSFCCSSICLQAFVIFR